MRGAAHAGSPHLPVVVTTTDCRERQASCRGERFYRSRSVSGGGVCVCVCVCVSVCVYVLIFHTLYTHPSPNAPLHTFIPFMLPIPFIHMQTLILTHIPFTLTPSSPHLPSIPSSLSHSHHTLTFSRNQSGANPLPSCSTMTLLSSPTSRHKRDVISTDPRSKLQPCKGDRQ